jgi:methylase of polypeptide subunit release factors
VTTSYINVSERPTFEIDAAKRTIQESLRIRDQGVKEAVTRQTLVSGLADTFPASSRPWWVQHHILDAEANVEFVEDGKNRKGFVDTVVGLTAIEYETDLRKSARFVTGKHQVQQYCAGLLNQGADPDRVRGVLSDGVEWHAYEIRLAFEKPRGSYDTADIELVDIESLICEADDLHAERWVDFLTRYLGRSGTRPLTAASLANYLGFDSAVGNAHLAEFQQVVTSAIASDSLTAGVIQEIWSSFVAYLSVEPQPTEFDTSVYIQEFYLAIMARLACANIISRRALRSEATELDRILTGQFFEAKGLHRLVEYDYFGWLTSPEHIDKIRPLAAEIQSELAAYDFQRSPDEDLFGEMISSLAERTQRLLLGQEWTPAWLASRMAERMFDGLKGGEAPHFVDMCCGSGAMIVAVTRLARLTLEKDGVEPGSPEALDYLSQAATGFDIDPLAVILAKVNWVATNRDWLEPFDGSHPISLPIYHADSLFALAPVFDSPADQENPTADFTLRLLDQTVKLPRFLIGAGTQALFDALLDGSSSLAMHLAASSLAPFDQRLAENILNDASTRTATVLNEPLRSAAVTFIGELTLSLAHLQREGKNRIWAFIIRNSYRPGLVAGQFNGIISNPPWLALSKIGLNPFGDVLRDRAERYGLRAPGAAFPHLEMATSFLAHAVDHYLAEDGLIACILPDTIRNGAHHLPFRAQLDLQNKTDSLFRMRLDELWKVDAGVFKNRAAVVIGRKQSPTAFSQIGGELVGPESSEAITHYVASFGNRTIWSPNPPGQGVPGGYPPGSASQGADLMPRRLVMATVRSAGPGRDTIATPVRGEADWYLLSDDKKHKKFSMVTRTLPSRFVQSCFISKNLAPFLLTSPASTVLPIERTEIGGWRRLTAPEIAASPEASEHFEDLIETSDFGSTDEFWERGINYRSKLSKQVFASESWLVLYGAGGEIPAAAYVKVSALGAVPPIIDQTLYWMEVGEEDEAIYLTGLINSSAMLETISDFVPEGEFGGRHLHTLPSQAIPQYDSVDPAHALVVRATRSLITELETYRNGANESRLFTLEMNMVTRRNRVRLLMKNLGSYLAYEEACQGVYAAYSTVD